MTLSQLIALMTQGMQPIGKLQDSVPGKLRIDKPSKPIDKSKKDTNVIKKIKSPKAKKKADDSRPYRDRIEMFGLNQAGKVLGGYYDQDKNHGAFGGGVEDGETLEQAGAREFIEEAGYKLHNPRLLPIDPVTFEWTNQANDARRAKYRGSRTYFGTGEVGDPVSDEERGTDTRSALQNIRFRSLITALQNTRINRGMNPAATKARRAVLRTLLASNQLPVRAAEKSAAIPRAAIGAVQNLIGRKAFKGISPTMISTLASVSHNEPISRRQLMSLFADVMTSPVARKGLSKTVAAAPTAIQMVPSAINTFTGLNPLPFIRKLPSGLRRLGIGGSLVGAGEIGRQLYKSLVKPKDLENSAMLAKASEHKTIPVDRNLCETCNLSPCVCKDDDSTEKLAELSDFALSFLFTLTDKGYMNADIIKAAETAIRVTPESADDLMPLIKLSGLTDIVKGTIKAIPSATVKATKSVADKTPGLVKNLVVKPVAQGAGGYALGAGLDKITGKEDGTFANTLGGLGAAHGAVKGITKSLPRVPRTIVDNTLGGAIRGSGAGFAYDVGNKAITGEDSDMALAGGLVGGSAGGLRASLRAGKGRQLISRNGIVDKGLKALSLHPQTPVVGPMANKTLSMGAGLATADALIDRAHDVGANKLVDDMASDPNNELVQAIIKHHEEQAGTPADNALRVEPAAPAQPNPQTNPMTPGKVPPVPMPQYPGPKGAVPPVPMPQMPMPKGAVPPVPMPDMGVPGSNAPSAQPASPEPAAPLEKLPKANVTGTVTPEQPAQTTPFDPIFEMLGYGHLSPQQKWMTTMAILPLLYGGYQAASGEGGGLPMAAGLGLGALGLFGHNIPGPIGQYLGGKQPEAPAVPPEAAAVPASAGGEETPTPSAVPVPGAESPVPSAAPAAAVGSPEFIAAQQQFPWLMNDLKVTPEEYKELMTSMAKYGYTPEKTLALLQRANKSETMQNYILKQLKPALAQIRAKSQQATTVAPSA